ncbi:hypothetical protein WMF26_31150 [Sorangium sp. So ce185]|uniref:hypothetical protein n=1 Tax=Sorangium sp. So ce185 TaxID=3133287 RepID=UPI003F601056
MVVLLAVSLATTACIGADIDEASEEFVEVEESAAVADNGILANALSPNALSPNGVIPNALSPNALSPNALSPNALAPKALTSIRNPELGGALSRELVRYVVSCALRPDQSFAFSWTDSIGVVHPETYRGELGIADWWMYGPLTDPFYQRWLTACLASRMNWYGKSVRISLRGMTTALGSSSSERSAYTVREGAFWGNVFSSTPYLHACYSPAGVTRARAMERDCAAGHLSVDPVTGATTAQPCGTLAIVGSCDAVCNQVNADGGYYTGCLDQPVVSPSARTSSVITSFLPP